MDNMVEVGKEESVEREEKEEEVSLMDDMVELDKEESV